MGIFSYVESFFSSPPPTQRFVDRYVLVTGCDSGGIGNLIAKALHRRGYHVFAGCPSESSFRELLTSHRSPTFHPVILDVTKDTSIQACVRMIAANTKEKGLFALVNNAGCNEGFAFELTSAEEITKAMDVNFMGPIKLIKALLPSLRQNIRYNIQKPSKQQDISPRIINITSVLGRTTIPFYGAYSASKHALEAMLDTIRVELLPWKIHVTMIEPCPIRPRTGTPGPVETYNRLHSSPHITEQTLSLYGEECIKRAADFWQKLYTSEDSPKEIVRTIVDAMEVGFPKDRYVIGTAARMHVMVNDFLPRWVIDLAWGSMIRLIGAWPKQAKELENGVVTTE